MNETTTCKGCDESYRLTQDKIERMIAAAKLAPEDCVPDDSLQRRLMACSSCAFLADGHTCSICGCIVQIRAKLKAKDCPRPQGSLWVPYR